MTIPLRQSTAITVSLGPFVDSLDGNTEETALSIANTDIRLMKNGNSALVNKNSGGATHMTNGIYSTALDTTDTNTLGQLVIFCHVTGALYVRHEFVVVSAVTYDSLYAAAGTDYLQVDIIQLGGNTTSGTDLKDFADDGYDPATNRLTSVTAIFTGGITAASFAASAIDATAIASNAITSAKIATGAITTATFAAGAVNAAAIGTGAITNAKFAAGAIDAAAIASDAITAAKIATDAITAAKIASDAITEIQSGLATSAGQALQATAADQALQGTLANQTLILSDTGDIKTVTDQFNFTIPNQVDANALSGGGGGGTDWTPSEREEIRDRLGITGATAPGGNTPTLATAADQALQGTAANQVTILADLSALAGDVAALPDVAAIEGAVDSALIAYDVAAVGDLAGISVDVVNSLMATFIPVNVKVVNDTPIKGDGTTLNPWNPV